MITISEDPIDSAALLRSFETDAQGAGGVVSFSGLVRPVAGGAEVKSLFLQAYSPMTENGMTEAVTEAKTRWPLTQVRVVHRVGEMAPGETIVFVATASAHRRAAFEAADFLMDYLKTRAVFWKREVTNQGDSWIEPRDGDYADAARWKTKTS